MLNSAKVFVGQRVIKCTHGHCSKKVKCRPIATEDKFPKIFGDGCSVTVYNQ